MTGPKLLPFGNIARKLARNDSDSSIGEFMFGPKEQQAGALEDESEEVMKRLDEQVEEELVRYDLCPPNPHLNQSPLDFWKQSAWNMPHVALVAQHVLGIPGSTANVERLFSGAGRLVTRRRPRLQSKRASRMIFGHANVVRGIKGSRVRTRRLNTAEEAKKAEEATAAGIIG